MPFRAPRLIAISASILGTALGPGIFLEVAGAGPALAQIAPAGIYSLVSVPSGMELHAPNGQVVLEYVTVRPENIGLTAPSAAYFDPVNTPSGERVTNAAPNDHPHHRGIFFGFMNSEFHVPSDYSNATSAMHPVKGYTVERGDFWAWGAYAPREGRVIQNRSVKLIEADADHAQIEIHNDWLIDNKKMLDETDEAIVSERDGMYVLDLYYRVAPLYDYEILQSGFGGFDFQAQKFGDSYFSTAAGKVTLPDPHYSYPLTDWPPEPWYDFTIKLQSDGKTVGAAVIDHPLNPVSMWHNARYLWMLAPSITALGPLTITPDAPLTLRYRVVVHDGAPQTDALQKLAEEWRELNADPFVHPTKTYSDMLAPHTSYYDTVVPQIP
jgi:Methane oxygenase PmoA